MSGTNATMTAGFHHVAFNASDFDRTLQIYTDVLGMKLSREWGSPGNRAAMLDTGDGSYLEVFEKQGWKPNPDGAIWHLALRTTRIRETMDKVRAAGLTVTREVQDIDIKSTPVYPVTIAFFEGPDGEVVELFQER
jgi:catechol 2,3-dioxygenase-like lactoylglutathione lyase family enzyme